MNRSVYDIHPQNALSKFYVTFSSRRPTYHTDEKPKVVSFFQRFSTNDLLADGS